MSLNHTEAPDAHSGSKATKPGADGVTRAAARREVPAVRRACGALWLLARHPQGLTLSRVARELEIIPSSCLHILRELGVGRLVTYDANTKLYRLGSGILSLGRELTQQNPFVQAAQPHLNRLSREYEVGASGQERDGDNTMFIIVAASVAPGDMVSPGGRTPLPLFTSASGRVMASYSGYDDAELKRRFTGLRWQSPPPFKQWLTEVRGVPGAGYAIDIDHFRKGITAIAAPIFNADGGVERAISITTISAQLEDADRKRLVRAVKGAAAEITQALR